MCALFALATLAVESQSEETNLFGAHMQQPEIVVTPESNGVMELTCKVGFIGGCCFPLTSHNITASLDVPQGMAITSGPEPLSYPAIEARPNGTPLAWAVFRWRLQRTKAESGNDLTITVSSPDSGQVKRIYTLGQQSSIKVSGPALPDVLPMRQDVPISVNATCLDQNRFVKDVRFWYSTEIPPEAEKVDVPPDLAARGIIRFSVAGRQLMVQGQSVDLARKYEPTTWHGTLPAQTNGPLSGVAVATDDAGKTSCGPVLRMVTPGGATTNGNTRLWMLVGAIISIIAALALLRRGGAFAVVGVVMLFAVATGVVWIAWTPTATETAAGGYPANSSTVAYLFLDRGDSSRLLVEQMETYRRVVPHRLHVLCFVEGVTPAPVMSAYRERYHVGKTPTIVFDGHVSVDGTNAPAVAAALDTCFGKPASRLSMELQGGVIAGHELSLGFIMCNHASRHDAHGSVSAFAFENGVMLSGWRCDHVVRQVMLEDRQYAIPMGKCQPPAMFKWGIPDGVTPSQTGAVTVIMDEQGHLIDSICTERPCSRTGVCG